MGFGVRRPAGPAAAIPCERDKAMNRPFAFADAIPVASDAGAILVKDQTGRDFRVPLNVECDSPYFSAEDGQAFASYYRENGYVVLRNLIPADHCAAVGGWFDVEVKPSTGYIYRQTTANPERHVFSQGGHMMNPILNIQSLDQRCFANFRAAGLTLMTLPALQAAVRQLIGENPTLVQSMFFEGNPVTWAHQDTYYLDGERPGSMVGAWIALEDIDAGAGRFFIYPGSHRLTIQRHSGEIGIAYHHDRYKDLVVDMICLRELECRAPALRRGDVLFWSSRSIHGSLPTTRPECSRRSVTAHFIPESSRLLQFQSRVQRLSLQRICGMPVHMAKDLNRPLNRFLMQVETRFPKSFQALKKMAISRVTG
ncbi:MAG: phytanoyl-CoA dioxygenase family protein [Alphaproteobacteria bacterium]|nr:phytanoyl-CoA dioxygenase family protein [Alphaproteobacteria bacterium]